MSVITGLDGHSLSVLAIGLGVLADVSGIGHPDLAVRRRAAPARRSPAAETRAAIVVAVALATASAVILA